MQPQQQLQDEEGEHKPPINNVHWGTSQSKKIIMMDLMGDVLPTDETLLPADWAWEVYRYQPEFIKEKISYAHYEKNLKANRLQVAKRKAESRRQMDMFLHDLVLYPVKKYKKDGRPVFSQHLAHTSMQNDISEGVHETMEPSDFKQSRDEYKKPWYPKEFRDRMHQEVRAQKFQRHAMDEAEKRLPKRKTMHEGRQELLKDAVLAYKAEQQKSMMV